MAEVATRGPTLPSSHPLQFAGGSGNGGSSEATVAIKRKTPSELRENITACHNDGLNNFSASEKFTSERQQWCSSLRDSYAPTTSPKEARITQSYSTTEKCSKSTFRSVMELSIGGENISGLSIDMDKAFKGLATRVPPSMSAPSKSFEGNANPASAKSCSELHVPGLNIPLDFTLKTSMRVATSSSVNWFHRLMSCGTLSGAEQFTVLSANQNMNCSGEHFSIGRNSRANKTLSSSWVHPQCSLPTSVITALTSSIKQEGQMDFWSKRQLAWETAFRSLYVMLRKNICSVFYVCTAQFVAMFVSSDCSMESTAVCNAYLSQSTRTTRSLLKEQDICFTMPLCPCKVEQDTAHDLFELSEIERCGVGISKRKISVSDLDDSPESLLAFSGNNNVHGLYDFLLNYRFLLTSLSGYDVPLLYSPVPFESASLAQPEVKCMEVRRIDNLPVLQESTSHNEPNQRSNANFCCSIEIKDAHLPPWIIESVCDILASNDSDFEASFVTDPMTVGLNVALDKVCQRPNDEGNSDESLLKNHSSFGIKNTLVSPHLRRAFVKSLKHSERFYTASLSPV